MNASILLLIAVFAVILVGILRKSRSTSKREEQWPYYAKKPLSQPEQVLFFRLQKALPDHVVLGQVQISRFLGVKKGHSYQRHINRINRMSADYLICNKDASVIAAIELDDSTHNRKDRQDADRKKNRAIEAAGIRMIRWTTSAMPDESEIQRALFSPENQNENNARLPKGSKSHAWN